MPSSSLEVCVHAVGEIKAFCIDEDVVATGEVEHSTATISKRDNDTSK